MPKCIGVRLCRFGKREVGLPVAAEGRAEQREQRLVLVDRQQLAVRERPALRREVEAHDLEFAEERGGHRSSDSRRVVSVCLAGIAFVPRAAPIHGAGRRDPVTRILPASTRADNACAGATPGSAARSVRPLLRRQLWRYTAGSRPRPARTKHFMSLHVSRRRFVIAGTVLACGVAPRAGAALAATQGDDLTSSRFARPSGNILHRVRIVVDRREAGDGLAARGATARPHGAEPAPRSRAGTLVRARVHHRGERPRAGRPTKSRSPEFGTFAALLVPSRDGRQLNAIFNRLS